MIALLADHNIIWQAEMIWNVLSPDEWQSMNVGALLHFPDVALSISATDRQVWTACQERRLLLITANRNDEGSDSLESAIHQLNNAAALPALTISSPDDVRDFQYREDCAYRIADVATRIEELLGTGRLFIP
jgi:hypothetical protein